MYDNQRLQNLDKQIKELYKRLDKLETEEINESDYNSKIKLEKLIKEARISILDKEREYWELYPMGELTIPEEEATSQLLLIEQAVLSLEAIPTIEDLAEMFELMQEIRARLNALDTPASAKLKFAIPLILPLASYEVEIDTQGVIYKTWRSIKGGIRRLNPNFFRQQ